MASLITKDNTELLNGTYAWSFDKLLEVSLNTPEDFLKIKETLTRIGITVKGKNVLNQSCHIFHKAGKYYIVSFLEVFAINGRDTVMKNSDIARRNTIAQMLEGWGLCTIKDKTKIEWTLPISSFKVISHKEKKDWEIISRCKLGN